MINFGENNHYHCVMEKYGGTKYKSRWDASTWALLGAVAASCAWTFFSDETWPAVICVAMLAFVVLTFASVYYRIDGDKLVVYTFFIPTAYPIDKIKEIRPTKSVLSAPATSLTHRLAITFTDRKVLKSAMPLVISPVPQPAFLAHLLAINPAIKWISV